MVDRILFHSRAVMFGCCLAVAALSLSCKHVPKVIRNTIPGASGTSQLEVKVRIAADANKYDDKSYPVAFDLVLVTDKKVLNELLKKTAREWFKNRDQISNYYPKEVAFVWHPPPAKPYEWVPGQVVKLDRVPVKLEVVGAIVFANYFTEGVHRAPINPRKDVVINLGADDFFIEPQK